MNEKDLMRQALSAYGLDRQAIYQAARSKGAARLPKGEPAMMRKRKLTIALALTLAAACLGGGVYAAGVLLNAGQAAEAAGESEVAALFDSADAVTVNETQSDAGYDVTLLGLVTGEHLTDGWSSYWPDGQPRNGTTYAMVAVQKSDGAPMPELGSADDPFAPAGSFAQQRLAIPELSPVDYWLSPERQDAVVDGVHYILIACDNVEIFADREVALCISTGSPFYSAAAFAYDETTGAITAVPDYAGINLVFDLPLDPAAADPAAAQEFVDTWRNGGPESSEPEPGTPESEAQPTDEQLADMESSMNLYDRLCQFSQAVPDIGTKTASRTVPLLTESTEENPLPAGPGWYFGTMADEEFCNFVIGNAGLEGDALRAAIEDNYPVGEPRISSMSSSDTERYVYLVRRSEDDSMTAERWDLPCDDEELNALLDDWIAENAAAQPGA